MRRLLVGCLTLCLVGLVASAGDKAEKPAKPQDIFNELVGKFRAAKSKEAQQEVFKTYGEKLLAYAEANAKDPSAVEALFFVVQLPMKGKDTPKAKAMASLIKDHVKNPALGKQLKRFPASPENPEGLAFLKAVMKDNPDKTSQAYAIKALLRATEQAVQLGGRLKDEKFKERVETQMGKEAVAAIVAMSEGADKAIKEYKDKLAGDLKGVFLDLSVGQKAPEVESKDLEGKPVKLSQYTGKVVVIDIWATWCGPCVAMIPHTTKLVEKMKDKPFAFISVSADDKADTVRNFMKKTEMPWTHWYEGQNGKMIQDWEVEYFPTIYILDHKGVIRHKDLRGEKMDEAVETLLKEAEEAKKAKTE